MGRGVEKDTMSVSVMSASDAGPPPSSTGVSTVSNLAGEFYSLFVSAPTSTPVVATAPAPEVVPVCTVRIPAPMPIGCALKGVTPTVLVIAGMNGQSGRLDGALKTAAPLADLAKKQHNRIHVAFLGGVGNSEIVAERLVEYTTVGVLGAKPEDVHLIAGDEELQMLLGSEGNVLGKSFVRYGQSAKWLECIGDDSMDANGSYGLWIKQSGMPVSGDAALTSLLPSSGASAQWLATDKSMSLVKWKELMNKAFSEAVKHRSDKSQMWQTFKEFWRTGIVSQKEDPTAGLNCAAHRSMAVFAIKTARPFGTVQRMLQVDKHNGSKRPLSTWMDLGAQDPSIAVSASTWCGSTARGFRALQALTLDRTRTIDKLQYDVSCTLSSLVTHSQRQDALAQPHFPWRDFGRMQGHLGPCVLGGRESQEVLRAVHWKLADAPDVLMLLPEAYVRFMLEDYFQETEGLRRLTSGLVAGKLVLSDSHRIATRRPDLSEAEQVHACQVLGPRIWLLDESKSTTTQTFTTYTSISDPLAGLRVRWAFAPRVESGIALEAKDMPTLIPDNKAFEEER